MACGIAHAFGNNLLFVIHFIGIDSSRSERQQRLTNELEHYDSNKFLLCDLFLPFFLFHDCHCHLNSLFAFIDWQLTPVEWNYMQRAHTLATLQIFHDDVCNRKITSTGDCGESRWVEKNAHWLSRGSNKIYWKLQIATISTLWILKWPFKKKLIFTFVLMLMVLIACLWSATPRRSTYENGNGNRCQNW